MEQPVVYMIAGPNGAGKTTAAMKLLPNFLSVHEFVNADEIARGLNPLNPDAQAMPAGRLMLKRVDDLIAARRSFAFETTASSHVFVEKLKRAKNANYKTGLIYLWLPQAELAKKRVEMRVSQGGHSIPAKDIERRYGRGLINIVKLYLPVVDMAVVIDSTGLSLDRDKRIASKKAGEDWNIAKPAIWEHILKMAKEVGNE